MDEQLRRLTRERNELLMALAETLTQACGDSDRTLHPSGLSAFDSAIELLMRYGLAERVGTERGSLSRFFIRWSEVKKLIADPEAGHGA